MSGAPGCLEERELVAFLAKDLDEHGANRATEHMADCGRCRGLLVEIWDAWRHGAASGGAGGPTARGSERGAALHLEGLDPAGTAVPPALARAALERGLSMLDAERRAPAAGTRAGAGYRMRAAWERIGRVLLSPPAAVAYAAVALALLYPAALWLRAPSIADRARPAAAPSSEPVPSTKSAPPAEPTPVAAARGSAADAPAASAARPLWLENALDPERGAGTPAPAHAGRQRVVLVAQIGRSAASGARLDVTLSREGADPVRFEALASDIDENGDMAIALDAARIDPGRYRISIVERSPAGSAKEIFRADLDLTE